MTNEQNDWDHLVFQQSNGWQQAVQLPLTYSLRTTRQQAPTFIKNDRDWLYFLFTGFLIKIYQAVKK
jgi:hypothetical protein